jgi:hypothetical protein
MSCDDRPAASVHEQDQDQARVIDPRRTGERRRPDYAERRIMPTTVFVAEAEEHSS